MAEEIKEAKPLSRSEREAQIKDRAGLVIVFMALFLAANTYIANNFSSIAQTNLLKATNTYGFYQSKSEALAEVQDMKGPIIIALYNFLILEVCDQKCGVLEEVKHNDQLKEC